MDNNNPLGKTNESMNFRLYKERKTNYFHLNKDLKKISKISN